MLYLDGFVARNMTINSVMGSYLDPLADKVTLKLFSVICFSCGSLFCLFFLPSSNSCGLFKSPLLNWLRCCYNRHKLCNQYFKSRFKHCSRVPSPGKQHFYDWIRGSRGFLLGSDGLSQLQVTSGIA